MTEEDDWVKLALNDDFLVVDILSTLRHLPSLPPPHPPQEPPHHRLTKRPSPVLKIDWSVKQRRSKQASSSSSSRNKKEQVTGRDEASTRASPTTPLSWSGGTTSASGGGGFEESSLPTKTIDTARSKVAVVTCETSVTGNKRSRKKKTLPELKEEESSLLKERRNLKNQLATLRLSLENQRAANERLKRLKLDLLSRQISQTVIAAVKTDEVNSNQLHQIKLPCDPTCSIMEINAVNNKLETYSSDTAFQKQEVGDRESFMLPDLNLPVEDNSSSDVLYGIS